MCSRCPLGAETGSSGQDAETDGQCNIRTNTNKKHFIKRIRSSTNSVKALYLEVREEVWDYLISYRYLHYICFTTWFPYLIIFLFQIESRQTNSQFIEPVKEITITPCYRNQQHWWHSQQLHISRRHWLWRWTYSMRHSVRKPPLPPGPRLSRPARGLQVGVWHSTLCSATVIMISSTLLYLMKILFRSVQDRDLFIRCSSKKWIDFYWTIILTLQILK